MPALAAADGLGRAVVLAREDRPGFGLVLLELDMVADGPPRKGVDRLVRASPTTATRLRAGDGLRRVTSRPDRRPRWPSSSHARAGPWSATRTSRSTPFAGRPSATSSSSSRTTRTPGTILLEQNYRSTQTILRAANAVISKNNRSPDQETCGPTPVTADKIVGYVADNEHDEAAFVAPRSNSLSDEHGVKPRTWLVRLLPHQRSVACHRGRSSSGSPPYKVVGGPASTSAERFKDVLGPTCGSSPTHRHRQPSADPQCAQARIGDRAVACILQLAEP